MATAQIVVLNNTYRSIYPHGVSYKFIKEVKFMYAIFVTGGKQYRATVGDKIFVEKLDAEVDQEVVFDQVLLAGDKIGQPLVEGAKVIGVVEKQGRDKKIIVYHYNPKKNYHKKQGHRQAFTKVVIKEIVA